MGNHLSLQGWKKKKRKRKRISAIEREPTYIYEGGLEIDHYCEVGELSSNPISPDYWTRNKDCKKADRHSDFIPFKDLTLDDLPDPIRHPAVLDYIRARGNLVVFISVSKKSPDRKKEGEKDLDFGHGASGYACVCVDETETADCPIPNCPFAVDDSEDCHQVYGGILVMTNRHVIIDDFECQHSDFHFFYDNGRPNKAKLKGHGLSLRDESSASKDYVGVKIFLHDPNIVEQIRQFSSEAIMAWHRIPNEIQTEFESHAVVISHPHHLPKQVSFGRLKEKEQLWDADDDDDDRYYNYTTDNKLASSTTNTAAMNNNDIVVVDPDTGNSSVENTIGKAEEEEERKPRRPAAFRVSRYTTMTCNGSSGSPVLTGFYWNNPFIHSSGFLNRVLYYYEDGAEAGEELEIWGESYFY